MKLRTNRRKSSKAVENSGREKSKSPGRRASLTTEVPETPTTKIPETVPELEPYQPKDLQHYASESGFKLIDPADYPQYAKYFEEPEGERFGEYGDRFEYRNIHILPSREERFFAPDNTFEDPRILEKFLADPMPEEVENKAELEKGVLERNTEAAKYKSFRSYARTPIGPSVQADSGDSEYENDNASGSQQSDPDHQPLSRSEFHTFNVAVGTLINKVHENRTEVKDPCNCKVYEKKVLNPKIVENSLLNHQFNSEGEKRFIPKHFYSKLHNRSEYDVNAFLAEPKVAKGKKIDWNGPSETVKRDVPAEQSLIPDLVPDLAPGKKPRKPLPSGRPLVCLTDHCPKPQPEPEPEPKSKPKPKPKNKNKKNTPKPSLSQQSTENGVNVQQNQATLEATSSTGTTRQRSIEPTYMDKYGVPVLSMRLDSPKMEAYQENDDLPEEQETMQSTPTTGLSPPPSSAGQKRKSTDQPSSGVDKKLKTMPSSYSSVSREALTMAGNQSATTAQAALVNLSGQPLTPAISTPSDREWTHDSRGPIFGNIPEVAPPRPEFLKTYKKGNLAYFGLEKNEYLNDTTPTPPGKYDRGTTSKKKPSKEKLPSWPWVIWTILAKTPNSFSLPLAVIENTAYEWIPALPKKNQTVRSALTGPKGGGSFIGDDGMWRLRNIGEEVVKKPGGANKGGSNRPQSSTSPEIQTGEPDHPSAEDPEYFEDSKMS